MPKCDFNKVALIKLHGFSSENLLYIFRTTFPKNTSGWLLLNIFIPYKIWNVFFKKALHKNPQIN